MVYKSINTSSGVGKQIKDDEDDSYVDYFYDDPGAPPGTLDLEPGAPPPDIVLIDYSETTATRSKLVNPQDAAAYLDTESVSWVDMLGLGNKETWQQMGQIFNLHLMTQEDVVNVPQRPKVVDYEDHLLIIAWMVMIKPNSFNFHKEQVSLILGKHYLLTVQEEPDYDCFDPVRDRIRKGQGSIRKHGADYLAYTLLDSIIDGFFPVLEVYGELIEELEDEVVVRPTRKTLEKIYKIRRELLTLRRAIWPQRDAINALIRDSSDLISPEVRIYLRDCYDHTVQVMDMVETYRELASGLMDVYLSSVGNKMNEIMKLLTVISSIFIPLTFVVGVYGMNFNSEKSPLNMPELNWYFGYPLCWALMVTIASSLVYFFWRRGWFENFSSIKDDGNLKS
ncbi:MAG: magnesium and cobalt transport protein CorA [Oscillatoriales cyanobacterium]|uniref:Magnesium transport protein CorA n=1 Tax=Microcoleus anatoxicus PTRS2 TaxID=2705321 RepID=A0ABU8YG69_9CYAN|nr:MAG: magnesium and cobalt transport protein CorA [Oscillatoriales cyanobacterium]TAD95521.1 MAG: magnesium and cobalt transport protein CorA [Oscillatoriales cyanobacterium]TAE01577.1 MAG: magnesium and cobalt transport protein CorA [Oscillatoriales cyanobacterium]TAF04474.1 MAG: magnesium and cobalt transport protein CorA [Oscillatoriales cyanobacterium]TAF29886.1 MAG: magnesium and cobalt transport protein CorA [Oscillatoriales cyanobacterium]